VYRILHNVTSRISASVLRQRIELHGLDGSIRRKVARVHDYSRNAERQMYNPVSERLPNAVVVEHLLEQC